MPALGIKELREQFPVFAKELETRLCKEHGQNLSIDVEAWLAAGIAWQTLNNDHVSAVLEWTEPHNEHERYIRLYWFFSCQEGKWKHHKKLMFPR